MMIMSETINRVICGDNLEILKEIETESVDLCYIDPPFFSGRNYAVIWNDGAEVRQFEDRWVKMGKGRMSKDINVYLDWMEPRLKEIHRVLKKTGSFYLHCDWHADAYLRVMCDNIFGYNNFRNEIIWDFLKYQNSARTKFSRGHDMILFYVKSKKYTFNIIHVDYNSERRKKTIEKGYNTKTMNGKRHLYYYGDKKKGIIDESKYDFIHEIQIEKGIKQPDIFRINILNPSAKERLGYPTQKPEALLERIIKASSNKGDVVLDAFCGCGTTLAVAKRLDRQFIGIDVSPTACRLMADRIGKPHKEVEGLPLTKEEIGELSGWEFQNWINREFGAINGKRGADGGIDGTFEEIFIQVKKYKVGRPDLDSFSGVLVRKKKEEGIFIGLKFTSTFIKEVSRLKRENKVKIHYFTVDDILENKHLEFTNSIKYAKSLGVYVNKNGKCE